MKHPLRHFTVGSLVLMQGALPAWAQTSSVTPSETQGQAADSAPQVVEVIGQTQGRGEARANSVLGKELILAQPAGLDPLKLLARVPGVQVSSGDALGGSFSMRLSMRGLNKEQIGMSVDGIPVGSTLSNGGTMPNRLLESANLERVEASQTAGDLGTPSNQALGGFVAYKTRNPSKNTAIDAETTVGNYGYRRAFVRYDTGRLVNDLSAYVDFADSQVRTWPGEQSGSSRRQHADLKVMQELAGGSVWRATISLNDMRDNDYDALALRAVAAPFYKAVYETNPDSDGLTDRWTGNPAVDQNNRGTRGINSREIFAHAESITRIGDFGKLSLKPYLHHQDGNGWFYVPYRQLQVNGRAYQALAAGAKPTPVVQECYANQYLRSADGSLVASTSSVIPAGSSAAELKAAGCPVAAKYQMNPVAEWGAREATRRRSDNKLLRRGALLDYADAVGANQQLRVGAWYEHVRRAKVRNWYGVIDPSVGSDYRSDDLYAVTQDRHYTSQSAMAYLQDKIRLLDDALEADLGVTYQRFNEQYRSPVEFNGERALRVQSGLLPKLAVLVHLNDDWEAYISGAKNFSAIPDAVFEGTAAVQSGGIQPETSINRDLGVRWSRGRFGWSLAGYVIHYSNRISIQNGNPGGDIFSRDASTSFANQGGIVSRGLEMTAQMAGQHYDVYASVSTNHARYIADTPAEGIAKDDPVLGAARRSAFIEANWHAAPGWRLSANAKYTGEAAGTYGPVINKIVSGGPASYPRETMPSYTLVGLSLRHDWPAPALGKGGKLELSAQVDNACDRRYLGGLGSELTSANPLSSGRYFLGSPRTLFVSLRGHFD